MTAELLWIISLLLLYLSSLLLFSEKQNLIFGPNSILRLKHQIRLAQYQLFFYNNCGQLLFSIGTTKLDQLIKASGIVGLQDFELFY